MLNLQVSCSAFFLIRQIGVLRIILFNLCYLISRQISTWSIFFERLLCPAPFKRVFLCPFQMEHQYIKPLKIFQFYSIYRKLNMM